MYERWQKKIVENRLRYRRAVLLSGPRQCGKTTLVSSLGSEKSEYRTLDEKVSREFALNDPVSFVKHDSFPLIIDEVQKVPELMPAIKKEVDENQAKGRFLLTGSANIQSLPQVQESMAGRVGMVRLRPLARGEILGNEPSFLVTCFRESFKTEYSSCDRGDIIKSALRGGFPEPLEFSSKEAKKWHMDYLKALIERDLQDIQRINRLDSMKKLVECLAAWSSKFMDLSSIGAGLSVKRPTLETYINALETLYLVERVTPWTKTDYDRVGKRDKIFFTDSGLMSSILKWSFDKINLDGDRLGKLIETFAFQEIMAQIDCSDGEYSLYHYRDREKREIDFLIESEDESLLGIEVKASQTIGKDDFKHLNWFKDKLAGNKNFIGIVLYTGTQVGSMGDNMWALPFNALWD